MQGNYPVASVSIKIADIQSVLWISWTLTVVDQYEALSLATLRLTRELNTETNSHQSTGISQTLRTQLFQDMLRPLLFFSWPQDVQEVPRS